MGLPDAFTALLVLGAVARNDKDAFLHHSITPTRNTITKCPELNGLTPHFHSSVRTYLNLPGNGLCSRL